MSAKKKKTVAIPLTLTPEIEKGEPNFSRNGILFQNYAILWNGSSWQLKPQQRQIISAVMSSSPRNNPVSNPFYCEEILVMNTAIALVGTNHYIRILDGTIEKLEIAVNHLSNGNTPIRFETPLEFVQSVNVETNGFTTGVNERCVVFLFGFTEEK